MQVRAGGLTAVADFGDLLAGDHTLPGVDEGPAGRPAAHPPPPSPSRPPPWRHAWRGRRSRRWPAAPERSRAGRGHRPGGPDVVQECSALDQLVGTGGADERLGGGQVAAVHVAVTGEGRQADQGLVDGVRRRLQLSSGLLCSLLGRQQGPLARQVGRGSGLGLDGRALRSASAAATRPAIRPAIWPTSAAAASCSDCAAPISLSVGLGGVTERPGPDLHSRAVPRRSARRRVQSSVCRVAGPAVGPIGSGARSTGSPGPPMR